MDMSLQELYSWLAGLEFIGFKVIWIWLITAPWWLAICTVLVTIFVFRFSWGLIVYFLNWLFDWTFKAGLRCGEWLQVLKGYKTAVFGFGKLIRNKFTR